MKAASLVMNSWEVKLQLAGSKVGIKVVDFWLDDEDCDDEWLFNNDYIIDELEIKVIKRRERERN